ncbi:hypothetical protein D477_004481 [Arthrobacter crystallopoietes BAB-32]|uniref:Uncharacterized protein n=1 Tax=Arthrobacter crystallopoietes BAB-32 TaxID=1246476 RepID=N1VAS2_9MICC|nr:hypothetical protein [Arthrobacter crystallopoietes]EMY35403.1 hypothetical protein D477_004481 [Arthrobacter crystallopoietes BAB-32]
MSDGYAIFDTGNEQRDPVRLRLGHSKKMEIIRGLRAAGLRSKGAVLDFLMKTTGRPIANLTELYDIEAAKILTELHRISRRTTLHI